MTKKTMIKNLWYHWPQTVFLKRMENTMSQNSNHCRLLYKAYELLKYEYATTIRMLKTYVWTRLLCWSTQREQNYGVVILAIVESVYVILFNWLVINRIGQWLSKKSRLNKISIFETGTILNYLLLTVGYSTKYLPIN